jgi:tRNA threonylcarbamoyladenosine biosynthesis protein TsaE
MRVERRVRIVRTSDSEESTVELARSLGERIDRGLWVSLEGDLGAGKPRFVRGLCQGLGVEEAVLSPTFVLWEEFRGRLPVLHVDLYRLEHERELEELGLFDRYDDRWVVLLEWGDRSEWVRRVAEMVVRLEITGEVSRRILLETTEVWRERLEDWR